MTGGRRWVISHLTNVFLTDRDFQTRTFTVKTSSSLGKLLLLKVQKDPRLGLREDQWFCSKMVATTPEGEDVDFPCYRWISRGENVELRGGRGLLKTHKMTHYGWEMFIIYIHNEFSLLGHLNTDFFCFCLSHKGFWGWASSSDWAPERRVNS